MLKVLGIVVVLAVVIVLGLALTKPDTFLVERRTTIAAAPATIAALVSDFHNWNQWSPWAHLDPGMRVTYSGPASGPGAVYEWEGNRKVGKGRMEVLDVEPVETRIRIDFLKPLEGHDTSEFNFQPDASGTTTQVRWVMTGPNTFPDKLMSVFTSMDHVIGPDFERGLANLKTTAEHPPNSAR